METGRHCQQSSADKVQIFLTQVRTELENVEIVYITMGYVGVEHACRNEQFHLCVSMSAWRESKDYVMVCFKW